MSITYGTGTPPPVKAGTILWENASALRLREWEEFYVIEYFDDTAEVWHVRKGTYNTLDEAVKAAIEFEDAEYDSFPDLPVRITLKRNERRGYGATTMPVGTRTSQTF